MSNTLDLVRVADGSQAIALSGSPMYRNVPEPRNSGGSWLNHAVSGVNNVLGGAASVFGGATDIPGLLNKQIEIQMIMQLVSMESNIARSKHETEMAPIRNMRIG
jgi:hypothetical protein